MKRLANPTADTSEFSHPEQVPAEQGPKQRRESDSTLSGRTKRFNEVQQMRERERGKCTKESQVAHYRGTNPHMQFFSNV